MATPTGSNQTQYSTADIQRNLGGLAVDNQYGAQTTAAVKAFQSANGLTADGIFGQKTLAAFQAKYGTGTGTAQVVNSSNLAPAQQMNIPPASTHGSLATELGTQIPGLQNDVNTISDNQNQGVNDVQKLQDMLVGQTADTQQAEQQVGLPQLNTDLRDLQNLSKSQTAKYIQGIQNLEVKGGAAINVNAKEAFLNRQNAIDSMLTNSLISAKSGDIQTAQSQVDRAISLKYDPIKQQIQNKLDFLKLNADNLSRADKKLADAKSTQLQLQLKQIDEQQQTAKDIQSIALEAAKNGAGAKVLKSINGAKTYAEAISLGGAYMVDPLDKSIKQAQLRKLQLEADKISNEQKAAVVNSIVNEKDPTKLISSFFTANPKIKTNQDINNAAAVVSSINEFSSKVGSGKIKGYGLFGGGYTPEFLKSQEGISNKAQISAVEGKLQQWLSGAALSKAQEKLVKNMIPERNDTDATVRTKLNQLTNYMLGDIKGRATAQGAQFEYVPVDLFSTDNASVQPSISKSVVSAISSGYSPSEVISYVENSDPVIARQITEARNQGYSDDEIISFLSLQ